MTVGHTFGAHLTFHLRRPYKSLSGQSQTQPIFKKLWKTSCQGKHKIFFWLVLRDKLSIRNMTRRRGMHLEDYKCVLCQLSVEETLMHLFFQCPFSKDCWRTLNFQFAGRLSILQIFQAWRLLQKVDFALDIFILACWAIWMVRNDVIFRNKNKELQEFKRYLTTEALLLIHRMKPSLSPILESWISSHL